MADLSGRDDRLAGPSPGPRRAFRAPSAWLTLICVFAIGLGADLFSKSWSFRHVAGAPVVLDRERLLSEPGYDPIRWHPRKAVLPGRLMDFKLVLNPGAVFGIGANQRLFFIAFTVAALGAGLLVFGRFTTARDRAAHVALGLILAGGLGNLYDRLVFGRVRDFIQVLPGRRLPNGWTWPGSDNPEMFPWVFNVADVLLLVGMIVLMVHINRRETSVRGLAGETSVTGDEDVGGTDLRTPELPRG